jgi:hypothetical protein
MSRDNYQLTPDNYQLSTDNYQLTPDNYQLTPDNYQLSTDNYQLTPDNYQLSTDNYQLSPDNYQLSPDNYQLTPDNYQFFPAKHPKISSFPPKITENQNHSVKYRNGLPESLPQVLKVRGKSVITLAGSFGKSQKERESFRQTENRLDMSGVRRGSIAVFFVFLGNRKGRLFKAISLLPFQGIFRR